MATNSKIEWTDHTANLWWGCERVGEGCVNCYAAALANRWGKDLWDVDVREYKKQAWKDFGKWQKDAKSKGEHQRVFVGSMMDIFEKPKPVVLPDGSPAIDKVLNRQFTTGSFREYFFHSVVPNHPNLIFLLLTKRASNIKKYIPSQWLKKPPGNVMYGVTVANNKDALVAARALRDIPGPTFWSCEPLLEGLYLDDIFKMHKPDWIICGGESGHGKRPFKDEWAMGLKADCEIYSIPFFMKQMDKVREIPQKLMVRQLPALLQNTI